MTLRSFVHAAQPTRVVFGAGSVLRIPQEAERLGLSRLLVLSTPGRAPVADGLRESLRRRFAGGFLDARPHTPIEVTNAASELARQVRADGLVAIGGGSTIGLSKALSHRLSVPQIAVPTTYAGSEMTSVLGQTVAGEKRVMKDAAITPAVVVYDVDLSLGLPVATSSASGMNAIAHAVEASYAPERSPLTSAQAAMAIQAFAEALPVIAASPGDRTAREKALYGAWLSGACLNQGGMGLHHKLCHVLGGTFGLPHAETHSAVLPHVVAYNAAAAPEAMRSISLALGGADPAAELFDLAARIGAPVALGRLGLQSADLSRVADLAMSDPYPNPRPLDRTALIEALARAWAGDRPQSR